MPKTVGIFGGIFSDPKPVVKNMPMQSYVFEKNGAFTVTLQDGEIWEQSLEDEIYHPARWRREASEMRVDHHAGRDAHLLHDGLRPELHV